MDKSKRNLTKLLGVAGSSVVVWKKPAVDSVILPTHAQTTCTVCFSIDLVIGGNWDGGYNFSLATSDGCNEVENINLQGLTAGTYNETFCFDLAPGVYHYTGGAGASGSSGSVDVEVRLGCCNGDDFVEDGIIDEGPGGGNGEGVTGTFSIGENGLCDIEIGDSCI